MRFTSHYLFPLDILVRRKDHEGEGFAIMTVVCSFIEFLAAFQNGQIFNLKKAKNGPNYEYTSSKELYINFLRTASVFEDHFWKNDVNGNKIIDQPLSATDFYENVRCGLIHEGRTKNRWLINATKTQQLSSPIFILLKNGNKSIMRSIMHSRMLDYLHKYSTELKENSQPAEEKRRLFARKMDHLYEIPADPILFDWWIDR